MQNAADLQWCGIFLPLSMVWSSSDRLLFQELSLRSFKIIYIATVNIFILLVKNKKNWFTHTHIFSDGGRCNVQLSSLTVQSYPLTTVLMQLHQKGGGAIRHTAGSKWKHVQYLPLGGMPNYQWVFLDLHHLFWCMSQERNGMGRFWKEDKTQCVRLLSDPPLPTTPCPQFLLPPTQKCSLSSPHSLPAHGPPLPLTWHWGLQGGCWLFLAVVHSFVIALCFAMLNIRLHCRNMQLRDICSLG